MLHNLHSSRYILLASPLVLASCSDAPTRTGPPVANNSAIVDAQPVTSERASDKDEAPTAAKARAGFAVVELFTSEG